MTDSDTSNRDLLIAAALATLIEELEDDRLITMATCNHGGQVRYAFLAKIADQEIEKRKATGEWRE